MLIHALQHIVVKLQQAVPHLEEFVAQSHSTFANYRESREIVEHIQTGGGLMQKLEIVKNSFILDVREMPTILRAIKNARITAEMPEANHSASKERL